VLGIFIDKQLKISTRTIEIMENRVSNSVDARTEQMGLLDGSAFANRVFERCAMNQGFDWFADGLVSSFGSFCLRTDARAKAKESCSLDADAN